MKVISRLEWGAENRTDESRLEKFDYAINTTLARQVPDDLSCASFVS